MTVVVLGMAEVALVLVAAAMATAITVADTGTVILLAMSCN